jgi:hypothetical protein
MIDKHDAKTLNITPNKSEKKLHNYEVTYHFVDGHTLISTSGETDYNENEFYSAICYDRFVKLPNRPIVLNMNLVTYIEVKEITNDK